MKYSKNEYITAIMWHYGFPKGKAINYYRKYVSEGNITALNLLVQGFKSNAKSAFYND